MVRTTRANPQTDPPPEDATTVTNMPNPETASPSISDTAEPPAPEDPTNGSPPTGFSIRKVFQKTPKFLSPEIPNTQKLTPPIINIFGDREEQTKAKQHLKVALKENQFVFKNLTRCTQLISNTPETFTKATAALNNLNAQYYHYPLPVPKQRRFVLYQLVDVEINEVIEDLHSYGLDPIEVKPMTIARPRYEGQLNLLVSFAHDDDITINILRKAKYIQHTVVKWDHFRQPADNILQCRNCFAYGHGTSGCHMAPRCMICANPHKTVNCHLILKKRSLNLEAIPEIYLKCCNCGGNHTAGFKNCPARTKFIQKRQRNQSKAPIYPAPKFVPAPAPPQNAWLNPLRPTPNRPPTTPIARPLPTPRRTRKNPTRHTNPNTRPKLIRSRSLTPTPKPGRSSSNESDCEENKTSKKHTTAKIRDTQIKNKNNLVNNALNTFRDTSDLFSPQEAMDIFAEMLSVIRNCKTKEQQLKSLMELAYKYQ